MSRTGLKGGQNLLGTISLLVNHNTLEERNVHGVSHYLNWEIKLQTNATR